MKASVRFWVLCALVGIILHFRLIPIINWLPDWCGPFVWYSITRIIRRYIYRRCPDEFTFRQPAVCIVTGASGGIGAECARELVSRGGWVVLAVRDLARTAKLISTFPSFGLSTTMGSEIMHLDLAEKKSIERFAENFRKSHSKLNVLMLNAGFYGKESKTADGFERTMGVNHLGHMYLTYLLRDMLFNTPHSRVVVVASDMHRWSPKVQLDDLMFTKNYAPLKAYNHSKLLNVLFARELSKRWKGRDLTVNTAHPGTPVQSDLMRDSFWNNEFCRDIFIPACTHLFNRKAEAGAQTLVYCAVSDECGRSTGYYYENCQRDNESAKAKDDEVAEKLWNISCDLLKIDHDWN